MPMKPIQVKANFQLDTSAAKAQLQGLQKELSSITKGTTMDLGITPQITQAVKQAQQLKQILAEATDFSTGAFDLSKFDAAIKQQGKSIAEFKQSLQTLGPEGEKAFNSLATTIASAQVPLKRTSQGLQQMMTAFGNTMRWQATSMAMHKVVGTIQQAFNYAQSLDKSLTNIQIVTGHNVDYMRNFAVQANKAAQALSASTLEYTNASLIYYQQGLSDKEVQKRAETTLKLAKVTGESASKISQQMTAVWNNFSNGVDNLERYADVMTALGATTASSSSEIAKGLEKFASVTKTIGLSYDYAASALATVTAQTRQSADSVGTAFKTLFSRLESLNLGETLDDNVTLNKYSEALLKVGVNVMDASGKLKNMDSILDELGGKWDSLNKAQQVALAQTVGGVRNYTSLITLMDNWDKFQTNLVTSQLAEGTLQHQADIYAQSWEAAQQRVKTASQGIYDTLISSDFFKGFNNAFAGVLNTINKAGQTLGSVGSTAGIMNLFLAANKDSVARGIDNTIVNTLGQTSFGQALYQKQQQELLKNFTQGIFDTGTSGSRQRQGAFKALTGQWNDFNKTEYKNKEDLALNQAIMQQRTQQVQAFMNSTIDTEQLSLKNNISQRALSEKLAGTYGLGKFNAKTVQEQLLNPFLGGGQGGIGNFRMGASGYINTTFMNQLDKLAAMDLTAGPGSRAEALAKQLQAQAVNAFKSNQIADLLGSNTDLREGMEKLMTLPLEQLMKPENISAIQESFSKFNVAQLQAYQNARQKLDQAFLSENEDAVLKDKEGNAILDKNGKRQIDTSSEKGKTYLTSMKDAETTAEQYLQKGLIDEQTYQDIKSGNKNLQDIIKQQNLQTTSFGQAAVSTGQMINSMAMATNSIMNFHQQVKDGTATATSLFTTMGSTGMALGQVASVLGNKTLIEGLGMSVKSLGMIAGGAAIVGIGALTAYKAIEARGLEAKSEYTNENKITLSSLAKENEQKYEQFLPIMSEYQNTLDKMSSLQQGTSAYTASLIAANNQAREIIETYNLQAGKDYNYKDGNYNFSAAQIKNINEQLLETSKKSDTYAQLGISANAQINSLLEKRKYDRAERIATINTQDYTEQYSGWIDTTWQYDQFQKDLQQIEDAHTIIDSEAYKEAVANNEKRVLAQKADFQVALESTISSFDSISDAERMAVIYLGENTTELDNYANEITEKIGPGGLTRDWLGKLRSEDELREAYLEQFGVTAAADATAQSIAAELDAKVTYDYLVERIKAYSEGENKLDSTFLSDFVNINTQDYKTMMSTFEKVQNANFSKETQEVYNTFIQKALTDSVKAQDNLVQAMLNNSQFERQDFLTAASKLQEEANLSTTELENVTNYLNNFTNNFGDEAGKAVFDALTNEGKGWNQDYYEALQKISLDNSISALADLTHFTNLGVNADLAGPLGDLRKAILNDIEDRGGLAKTLFTSSDFTKVFDSLSAQYKATGEITAQNISDLAKKNDIISDYMTVSGSNTQAIADMMQMISSGHLTAETITPAIEHFVKNASGAEGAQQDALDVVAEQDFSDSITTMDKWAQNIGKAFYTGRTHDFLGDRPVLEGLKMVLTPEDYDEYLRILNTGAYGGTTSTMLSDMKSSMENAYAMLAELEGKGKYKGKGGGGMDTVYKYLAKEGIFDESGIGFDESSGRFTIGGNEFADRFGQGDEDKLITFNSLRDYIIESLMGSEAFGGGTHDFQGKGYSRDQAEDLAKMMLGSMSASSMGTVLSQSSLIDAAQTFFGEIGDNGEKQGNYITNEQYKALFDQYSDVLSLMKLEEIKDENGNVKEYKLREANKEELASGDYGVSEEDWENYFIQEAKKVGAAIIGVKGQTQLGKADAKTLGTAIADASHKTLQATEGKETEAIVRAAVAAGVQTYRDTWIESGNALGQAREKIEREGQSLDYDQLQEFYNNILGLSTETLNSHLKEISEQNGGLAFTHKYTDAYGVEHNINSRDYNGDTGAFTRAIEQENEFSNIVLQYQRDQWVQQYFNDEKLNGGNPTYEGAMDYLRKMTEQETAKAQAAAQETTQSTPNENPPEGEGEEGAGGEGAGGEGLSITGETTEADAWSLATKADKDNFVYSSHSKAADIYNYWKQHKGMTQAEAYDQVVLLGKKPEPPKTTTTTPPVSEGEETPSEEETVIDEEQAAYERWLGEGNFGSFEDFQNSLTSNKENGGRYSYTRKQNEPEEETPSLSEPEPTPEPISEYYEPDDIPSAEWEIQQNIPLQNQSYASQIRAAYEAAQNAENQFFTENEGFQEFLNDPENARLAAWTNAARMNPELLGALYQNALNEGYSGNEFTQMYDYQGLHEKTQEALVPYKDVIASTFNADNVTAQQRFNFINDTYNKALTQGVDKLSPFEKQILTMVGEINEATGELVTYSEEETSDAATRAKNNKKVDEETGQVLDENGEPINLPTEQPAQGTGNNGTGGQEYPTGGSTPKNDPNKFPWTRNGDGTWTNTDTGATYQQNEDGTYTVVDGPPSDEDIANATPKNDASGQNNARLLGYAMGKEGHIAVTGELGPELRVKEDGSMDLLGKTGREYTWVDPSDKIYTASQTASIMSNNTSIPQLEGLARGIRNYIPGYYSAGDSRENEVTTDQGGSKGKKSSDDSSGKSKSGDSEDKKKDSRYDPNTLKIRDILERYYTILQKIDDIVRAVERFSKAADRAWGNDRIKNIQQQTELYKQQYEAQRKYVNEIKSYMKVDKDALTSMVTSYVKDWNKDKEDKDKIKLTKAQFDENGVLTNYKEIVESLVKSYNKNADANAQDKKEQYKFQERLKDIQMYTDTLNLLQSETDKLQDLANQILDNSLKSITYEIEYKTELNSDVLRLINFQYDQVKDNIWRTAEAIELLNGKAAKSADNLKVLEEGVYKYLGMLAGESMQIGKTYTKVDLGLQKRDKKGNVTNVDPDKINEKKVSQRLDSWLNDLRKKNKEAAAEVDKIIKRNAKGLITNYNEVLNKLNEQNQRLSKSAIDQLFKNPEKFYKQMSDLTKNAKWEGFTDQQKTDITNDMEKAIEYIKSVKEAYYTAIQSMSDLVKNASKQIDSAIDKFAHFDAIYKSFKNIMDLTNQSITGVTGDFFNSLAKSQLENGINSLGVLRKAYEEYQDIANQSKEEWDAAVKRAQQRKINDEQRKEYENQAEEFRKAYEANQQLADTAYKDFLSKWEDLLSSATEMYQVMVEQATKTFEDAISPLFNSLSLLQEQFDREKQMMDLYVDDYQRLHDLSKLNRDIQNSILDTDNIASKERLRELQKEINKLQEDGTELSEYDLDILDKKYKLELARQALEDAKDAKSMVRLSRDNNGNWGYVYTSNEDDVDKAEQNYEDAIRDMEEANENYIKNLSDQILQVQAQANDALMGLSPDQFNGDYELFLQAVNSIKKQLATNLQYIGQQGANAFGLTNWMEDPNNINSRWNILLHNLTGDFGETPLSKLLANGDLGSVVDNAINNFDTNLAGPMTEEIWRTWSDMQEKITEMATDGTMEELLGYVNDAIKDINKQSKEQVEIGNTLISNLHTEFEDTRKALDAATEQWSKFIADTIPHYEELISVLTEIKKLDGERTEPATKMRNNITTKADLDEFKQTLAQEGRVALTTYDAATGKEKTKIYEQGSKEAEQFIENREKYIGKHEYLTKDTNENRKVDSVEEVVSIIKSIKAIGEAYYYDSKKKEKKEVTLKDASKKALEEYFGGSDNRLALNLTDKKDQKLSKKEQLAAIEKQLTKYGAAAYKDKDGKLHVIKSMKSVSLNTGGYTGRWQTADTGMYTGEWPMGSERNNGRLAWLHQKELVLNAHDTENFLDAMEIVRELDNLSSWMANGLGDLFIPTAMSDDGTLEQNVRIEASFPNVTDHLEIEQAFDNLVNRASQYANRKAI